MENGILKDGSDSQKTVKNLHDQCTAKLESLGKDQVGVHEGACERILGSILDSTVQMCVFVVH